MPFRFPLATLLRLREIAEQREERLLGQVQNQVQQARQTLVALEAERLLLIAQREHTLQQPTYSGEIAGFYGGLCMIDDHMDKCKAQLARLETLRDQQTAIYRLAHASKETLSAIGKKSYELYQSGIARKEQIALDDNYASRRALR